MESKTGDGKKSSPRIHDAPSLEALQSHLEAAAEFIRKNPWAAVLGAVAIGYLLARVAGPTRSSKR